MQNSLSSSNTNEAQNPNEVSEYRSCLTIRASAMLLLLTT